MNERIKELVEQCHHRYSDHQIDIEKFAELIVLECVGIVQPYMSRWPEDHQLTKEIKEHFGVK